MVAPGSKRRNHASRHRCPIDCPPLRSAPFLPFPPREHGLVVLLVQITVHTSASQIARCNPLLPPSGPTVGFLSIGSQSKASLVFRRSQERTPVALITPLKPLPLLVFEHHHLVVTCWSLLVKLPV